MFAFLAIDFETTGSVPGFPNEPWQIGTVPVSEDGTVSIGGGLDSLLRIDVDRPFNKFAPGRHAKIRAELAAAPTLTGLWPDLAPRLAGPVVAHNVGTERTILEQAAPLHLPGPWIDTLALARAAWPTAPSHALEDLIPALGLLPRLRELVPGREPHDAYYDAVACALLLLHLLSFPAWRDLDPERLSRIR